MECSLYVHVPFCAALCDYCDFYSVAASRSDGRLAPYADAVLAEAARRVRLYGIDRIPTIYVGGGTPSLLGAEGMGRLASGLRDLCPSAPGEFTVEANPESVTPAFVDACAAAGVDRLSLGAQTLHQASREAVGRIGDASCVRAAAEMVRSRFPGRFTIDFIAGLPLQDEEIIKTDLEFAVACGADHVSFYSLILEENTPLERRVGRGLVELPGEEAADSLWLCGRDFLEDRGFRQYEVSNFSKPGKESKHNLRYWRLESYLGVGPGAVGTLVDEDSGTARRYAWAPDADAWTAPGGPGEPELEAIGRKELIAESAIMGFRLRDGLDGRIFASRFGVPPEAFFGRTLDAWRGRGLARGDSCGLTREGLLLLDRFLVECLAELDLSYARYEDSRR